MVVTRVLASLCGGSEACWKDGKHCTYTHTHTHMHMHTPNVSETLTVTGALNVLPTE